MLQLLLFHHSISLEHKAHSQKNSFSKCRYYNILLDTFLSQKTLAHNIHLLHKELIMEQLIQLDNNSRRYMGQLGL